MSIFSRLSKAVKTGYSVFKGTRIAEIMNSESRMGLYAGYYGKPQPENYKKYTEAYGDEVWAYACARAIASTISGLPFKIGREVIEKDELVFKTVQNSNSEKLLKKPNQNDENSTYNNLIDFSVISTEFTGNAYWLRDKNELQPLISSRVKYQIGEKGISKYLYYVPNAEKPKEYLPEEITHFKYVSPDNYFYGQSVFGPARFAAETIREAVQTNINIFKNGAKTGGWLSTESRLVKDTYDRLRATIQEKYEGSKNAHRIGLLEQGLKFSPDGSNLKDLEFIEGMKLSREDICGVFGVPPVLVGILDHATYSNYEQAQKVFWEFTILPKLKKFEQIISALVGSIDAGLVFRFDTSNVVTLKENEDAKSQIAARYWNMGVPFNVINDKLKLGIGHITDGDIGYLPMSAIPAGTLPELPMAEEGNGKSASIADITKELLWKQFDRLTRGLENGYMRIISKHFSELERDTIARLHGKKDNVPDMDNILFDEVEEVKKWDEKATRLRRLAINENGKKELLNLGISVGFNVSNPRVVEYLRKVGLKQSKEVIGTLRDELRASIAEGVKQGESIADIARRIQAIYEPFQEKKWKAVRIARTEVIGASNQGALEAYKQSGLKLVKGWLAQRDDKARESHLAADATYKGAGMIDIDEDFEVGSDSMPAPGQGSDPAENIQCRCSIYSKPVRD